MSEVTETTLFQSLASNRTPWTRLVSSLAVHALAALVVIAIPVTVHRAVELPDRVVPISLFVPPPPPPAPTPVKRVPQPVKTVPVAKVRPRIQFHAPSVQILAAKTITLPPVPVEIPKPVEMVHLDAPKIELPTRSLIKQEVFQPNVFQPNNVAPVSQDASKLVKTGGFGNPDGARPSSTASDKGTTAPRVGSFDASAGQDSGRGVPSYGRGGSFGNGKVVASAGFGSASDGVGADPGGSHRAGVGASGFGDYDAPVRPVATAPMAARVTETPVEITFKPKPDYTPEARQKKIEGEVQLDVQFSSTGEVHVLRLIRGLGFGLDENARTAAGRIRFHPATRNGSPVDVTGIVHIVFELT
jgi:TonB family protein